MYETATTNTNNELNSEEYYILDISNWCKLISNKFEYWLLKHSTIIINFIINKMKKYYWTFVFNIMFGFTMENVRFCVTVKKAISQIIFDDFHK